jgi:acetate kinase
MALDKIILVSNPGSASRKYALFKGNTCVAEYHFEFKHNRVICHHGGNEVFVNISHVAFAPTILIDLIATSLPGFDIQRLHAIALRIVAPSSFFQRDHRLTQAVVKRLERMLAIAPLHIGATLSEYAMLKASLPKITFCGISDSAFLARKPEKAMHYGLPFKDANKLDIKRFGYHGLSLESIVSQLKIIKQMPQRVIICHIGGGVSIAAIRNGRVIDSTMGFSPLEGVMMATRSGSIDLLAVDVLRHKNKLNHDKMYDYFNARSGLLGVSGYSSDIRELLDAESKDKQVKLALEMYVYKIQQAIGSMASTMNGADALVFTGTVGQRSSEIRKRICSNTLYLGFSIDAAENRKTVKNNVALISKVSHPAKVFVVKTDENSVIAQHAQKLLS